MSLPAFRDYCRRKADDPNVRDADAALWAQLADEVDEYLGENLSDPNGDDLDLFAEVEP